jgi:hypothetical protein
MTQAGASAPADDLGAASGLMDPEVARDDINTNQS